jgi:hypothetical protein
MQYVDDGRGGWVMNCLACHGGKVVGQVIPGDGEVIEGIASVYHMTKAWAELYAGVVGIVGLIGAAVTLFLCARHARRRITETWLDKANEVRARLQLNPSEIGEAQEQPELRPTAQRLEQLIGLLAQHDQEESCGQSCAHDSRSWPHLTRPSAARGCDPASNISKSLIQTTEISWVQHRSASAGLTDAARHAGSIAAARPTAMSTTAAMAMVGTCKTPTPKSCDSTKRLMPHTAGSAIVMPAAIIKDASRMISQRAVARVAPSAMRTPISCVRCVTTNDITKDPGVRDRAALDHWSRLETLHHVPHHPFGV